MGPSIQIEGGAHLAVGDTTSRVPTFVCFLSLPKNDSVQANENADVTCALVHFDLTLMRYLMVKRLTFRITNEAVARCRPAQKTGRKSQI
jgi:hypothetical protein